MPMLDAALAFAVTMLAVASVVTAIVGKIGASATYRRDTFRNQLTAFYKAHVKEIVDEELHLAEEEADKRANEAVSDLMAQMKIEGKVELSTRDLLAGLSKTDLGSRLTEKVSGEVDQVVERLGAGWEQVGNEFTAKFRERAKLASLIIGIVIAGVLNVDSIHVIETYLTDDQVLGEVLGQQDAMLTQYAAFFDGQPAGDGAVDEARADIETIKADIAFLKGSGIPMGWDHWPWQRCGDGGPFLPRCAAVTGGGVPTAGDGWVLWLMGVLLTGYLAGLGAPFWYDLVSGISHLAQKKRGSQQRTVAAPES